MAASETHNRPRTDTARPAREAATEALDDMRVLASGELFRAWPAMGEAHGIHPAHRDLAVAAAGDIHSGARVIDEGARKASIWLDNRVRRAVRHIVDGFSPHFATRRQARTAVAMSGTAGIVAAAAIAASLGLTHEAVAAPLARVTPGVGALGVLAEPLLGALPGSPIARETGAAAPPEAIGVTPPSTLATTPQRGALPVGKGMWIWLPDRVEGGNGAAIVRRSQQTGLTHLYVHVGSSKKGFINQGFLNDLLPKAHAAGIRVYGWDFPYLDDARADVDRAVTQISYRTPDGHAIDGYASDIETAREGTNIQPTTAIHYGTALRRAVGHDYPLIAVVPKPNPALRTYPMGEVTAAFDAIAPMVYWLNRDPASDLATAMKALAQYGKPILPIGQAYDGAPEGGRPGVPPRHELLMFFRVAEQLGASGLSFWSWQHADQQAWDAIRDATEFTMPTADVRFGPSQIRSYQALLRGMGFQLEITGVWDEASVGATRQFQATMRIPTTGQIDEPTRVKLFTPFISPLRPLA